MSGAAMSAEALARVTAIVDLAFDGFDDSSDPASQPIAVVVMMAASMALREYAERVLEAQDEAVVSGAAAVANALTDAVLLERAVFQATGGKNGIV